eukprot:TRINITY_DN4690_c0_g1_i1.p4 TRINITY_DN4690_c0_g1~~TRINITY_DN4690_c0_g1_i1.p4  ORF type:complete len:220 (-),score=70.36 TRINITY_DN4690_c0_g1_i1:314-973(-)
MLLELYQPILWRALQVPNPVVRQNAASVLCEAFPLQDPRQSQRELDDLLQRQFNLFEELLFDPFVAVRTVAIHGVSRVVGIYWELIPDAPLRVLIGHLVNDLAFDTSAVAVRIAVLEGLTYILDNHLSQPLLKAVLPKLLPLLHDQTERVRIAFINLLTAVKSIKAIKFYEIAPVEHLLARLAVDSAEIGKKVTSLLLNSYMPPAGAHRPPRQRPRLRH